MTSILAQNSIQTPPIFVQPPPIINQYKAPVGGGVRPGAAGRGLLDLVTAFVEMLERAARQFWAAISSALNFGSSPAAGPVRPTRAAAPSVSKAPPVIRRATTASTRPLPPLRRSVWFNRTLLSDQLLPVVDHIFRRRLADGSYWYDHVSGEWGVEGRGRSGKIRPGLDLGGPLMPDASKGKTGVFVNGREITSWESIRLRWATSVPRGRYWVDHNGNFGPEGGLAMGNIRSMATKKILLAGAISVAQAAASAQNGSSGSGQSSGQKLGLFSENRVLSDGQGNMGWCGHDGSSASFGS